MRLAGGAGGRATLPVAILECAQGILDGRRGLEMFAFASLCLSLARFTPLNTFDLFTMAGGRAVDLKLHVNALN